MIEQLERGRALILPRLEALMTRFGDDLAGINAWGPDVCRRVLAYSNRGKMIRGSLVIAAAEAFGSGSESPGRALAGDAASGTGTASTAVVDAACAMELLQSFLLIHDDIMDNDDTRRGAPSVHAQYRDGAEGWGVRDHTDGAAGNARDAFGRSMAICAGDVTLLLAQRVLAALDVADDVYRRVNSLVAREIALVGIAQMNDLYFGYLAESDAEVTVTKDDVYKLYRYKTGRYTFSLPLAMGAVFAGLSGGGLDLLMAYGEEVGIVFQVVDDDIGLFGETEATGKPVGSDIIADKKTLHRQYLLEALDGSDAGTRDRVVAHFGDPGLDHRGVEEVRDLLESHGVRKRIGAILDDHADRARRIAGEIVASCLPREARGRARALLDGIVDYNVARRV
ncbi:MAG: polyprenyl synthetase family protein [Spirochaetota bacterium]